jgi:hypothetical protein
MATKPQTTTSAGTTMSPMDMVQNPNFDSAMNRKSYENFIKDQRARLDAERASGGNQDFIDARDSNKTYAANMVDYIDPATGEKASRTSGIVPAPGSRFVPVDRFQTPNQPIATTGSAMPQVNPQLERTMLAAAEQQRNFANQATINGQNATAYQANADGSMTPVQAPNPIVADQATPRPVGVQPNFQIPQMQQMQNYNQMLQQGMRRNQDMNQATQNIAAPAGPARSFSQVVGRTRRMNRMPRQPRNNFLAPSNQKLI